MAESPPARLTRTAVLAQAVQRELAAHRLAVDEATDLAEVSITLKLQAGSTWVRGVVWREERILRTRG